MGCVLWVPPGEGDDDDRRDVPQEHWAGIRVEQQGARFWRLELVVVHIVQDQPLRVKVVEVSTMAGRVIAAESIVVVQHTHVERDGAQVW